MYDAWNRLVQVKTSGGTLLKTYGYDGLGRRVTDAVNGGATTTFVYDSSWRVLEERVSGVVQSRYVWSPVYVDAMVLRDRDTDANGTLDERLYAVQDANWNTVALVDTTGAVVERYAYDPYGAVTVLDGSYGARGSSSYGWVMLHQGLRYDSVSGLYWNRNRDYSPTLGRFTTNDPLGYAAGDVNLYRYVGNGPGIWVDPSGLCNPTNDLSDNVINAVNKAWDSSASAPTIAGAVVGAVGSTLYAPEFGGSIFSPNNGGPLVYSDPVKGDVGSISDEVFPKAGPGQTVKGSYHTHPYLPHIIALSTHEESAHSMDDIQNLIQNGHTISIAVTEKCMFVLYVTDNSKLPAAKDVKELFDRGMLIEKKGQSTSESCITEVTRAYKGLCLFRACKDATGKFPDKATLVK